LSFLGCVYGRAGEHSKAQAVVDQLTEFSQHAYVSPYWWSLVYAGLDQKEQTLRQLEKVFDERAYGGALTLKVNPFYDSLRADPRYETLLKRAGFN
jgi:hypothetical protein